MKAPMLLALAALSISTAQAAEPTGTLTLACQGTVTGTGTEEKPELISMGVIVNFTTGMVQGFDVLENTVTRSIVPSMRGLLERLKVMTTSSTVVTLAQSH
jgi:hypothetical protein